MNFLGYLLLGSVVYVIGFMLNQKVLAAKRASGEISSPAHRTIASLVLGCFVVMLAVSALIGHFLLHHQGFDWAFIVVNSLVASVVFYFGLNPDASRMNLPD